MVHSMIDKKTALTAIILMIIFTQAFTQDFTRYSLQPEGAPEMEILEDLNRDGRKDVVLWDSRTFSMFFTEEGGIASRPSLVVKVPDEAAFLDVGDVGGSGVRDPVYMCREGVSRMVYDPGKKAFEFPRVLEFECRLIPPRVKRLAAVDILRDLTGDGKDDIVVPELHRLIVFENNGGCSFQRWGEIRYKPKADFYREVLSQTGRLKEVVHFPRLFFGKGKEKNIVILYDGTWVTICGEKEEGAFEVIDHRPLYGKDDREYEEESRSYFGKVVYFEDLDEDGAYSLIIADNRNGKVEFFKGGDMGKPYEIEQTIQTEGWILSPSFQDMNGDGLKDLILPSIEKIGIFTILRVFFTSRFDIQYMIFFNRRKPLYPILPDISRSVSLPLSFSAGHEGIQVRHSLIYSFEGDYNGDGMKDLLLKSSPKALGLFYGKRGRDYSEKPDKTLPFEPLPRCSSARTKIWDVNGDGISDIYLHQTALDTGKSRYDLYLSKK